MSWVLLLLRFGALFLSIMGYAAFARAFLDVPACFSYLLSLCVIGCAMFIAGLLGVLAPAAFVLLGLGYAFLLAVALADRLHVAFRRPVLNMVNVMFILWFFITCVSLINYRLIHYDNFSHWALVVKQMLATDAFPDASSALIDFKNYPLGVSAFLYFVCRVVGRGDGVMLVGQSLFVFASFYALNGVIRDRKRFLLSALLGLGGAIISYFNVAVRVNNLLVDYLLPLIALGSVAGVMAFGKRYAAACLASIPVLGFLMVVKNTGVFFAFPAFVFLLYWGRVARKGKTPLWKLIAWVGALVAIAACFIPTALWSAHTASAFAGETSKFQIDWQALLKLDLQNLSALLPNRTPEQLAAIAGLFWSKVTSPYQLATQGLLLANMMAVVAWLNARYGFQKRWKLLKVLVLVDLLMAIYYAGILLFYLAVMPQDEALRLAGFERYAGSMTLFVIGALFLCAVRDVERSLYIQQGAKRDIRAFKSLQTKRIYQSVSLAVFTVAMLFLMTDITGMNALQEAYPQSLPAHAETLLGNSWEPGDENRYLLYAPDTDSQVSNGYLPYIGRYLLFSHYVQASAQADDTLLAALKDFDYLAVVESDDAIRAFMQTHAGLSGDVGVYAVRDAFGEALTASAP